MTAESSRDRVNAAAKRCVKLIMNDFLFLHFISFKTSCSRSGSGCTWNWVNPSGGIVKVHSVSRTVQCLSCCEEKSTPSLCQCSGIKSSDDWKKCCKFSNERLGMIILSNHLDYIANGNCGFGAWRCNDTCLEFTKQCDGKCYGTLDKCVCTQWEHVHLRGQVLQKHPTLSRQMPSIKPSSLRLQMSDK